jgi:hypothetical protein
MPPTTDFTDAERAAVKATIRRAIENDNSSMPRASTSCALRSLSSIRRQR